MRKFYKVYFYTRGNKKTTEIYGTEAEAIKHAKNIAKIHTVEGFSLYSDGDVLVGDWSLKNGRYLSNVRKKKKDTEWHPFGL